MRNKANHLVHAALLPVLLACVLSAIGCGGGGAQSAGVSPSPSPTPTPAPSSATLSATPSSLGFGSQVLNTPTTQTTKITNTGSVAVAITQDTIAGAGFSAGITTPINLNPAQSVNVPVVFNPAAAGTVNGNLVLMSNGATVLSVPLVGTGLAPLAHSVDIAWDASSSAALQGYNVYRSTVSGGPYSKISPGARNVNTAFYRYHPRFRQAVFLRGHRCGYQRYGECGLHTGCRDHSCALNSPQPFFLINKICSWSCNA